MTVLGVPRTTSTRKLVSKNLAASMYASGRAKGARGTLQCIIPNECHRSVQLILGNNHLCGRSTMSAIEAKMMLIPSCYNNMSAKLVEVASVRQRVMREAETHPQSKWKRFDYRLYTYQHSSLLNYQACYLGWAPCELQ